MRKKIGLALGSGGTCGLSHIGILRALEEYRVPVDYIAGTSMGAIVGACYAAGKSLDEIEEKATALKFFQLADIDAFFYMNQGIIKGKKVENMLTDFIGKTKFKDLAIPFATEAVDLISGKLMVLDNCSLIDALRATSAIPGVFRPVEIDGKLFVDGGILERVPAKLVRDMGADIVIAVDVLGSIGEIKRPRNLIQILERAYTIIDCYYTDIKPKYHDVEIKIKQEDVDPFVVKNMDRAVAYGYNEAILHMDEILDLIK